MRPEVLPVEHEVPPQAVRAQAGGDDRGMPGVRHVDAAGLRHAAREQAERLAQKLAAKLKRHQEREWREAAQKEKREIEARARASRAESSEAVKVCVRVCVCGGDRVAQCFADSSFKAILRRATLQSG